MPPSAKNGKKRATPTIHAKTAVIVADGPPNSVATHSARIAAPKVSRFGIRRVRTSKATATTATTRTAPMRTFSSVITRVVKEEVVARRAYDPAGSGGSHCPGTLVVAFGSTQLLYVSSMACGSVVTI